MLSGISISVLALAAALSAAIGAGYCLRGRPDWFRWRSTRCGQFPWYFYGAATVFFLGLSLYSMWSSMSVAIAILHGMFAAFEAFIAAKQFGEQRPKFHVSHLALPAVLMAMLAAGLNPMTAFALPLVSLVAGAAVLVLFFLQFRSAKRAQA
jgi:hypothetical protein